MKPIKVLLVDDYIILIHGLQSTLNKDKELEVVGNALNGIEAIEKTSQLQPDVVIVDIAMPKLNGFEVTQKIKEILPDCRVIMMTMHPDGKYLTKALKMGVDGYLLKDSPLKEIVYAIKEVHRGRTYLGSTIPENLQQNV